MLSDLESTRQKASLGFLILAMLGISGCAGIAQASGVGDEPALDWSPSGPAGEPLHRSFKLLADSGQLLEDSGPARKEGLEVPPAGLVMPVLDDGSAFDEVLPSWNIRPDAAFAVDVRVAAAPKGPWTTWLRIGDWNVEEREGSETLRFEGGKVAVDVLQLEAPHRAAQFRVTPAGESIVEIAQFNVVLTDTTALGARIEEASGERWPNRLRLEVPPRSQRVEDEAIAHRICSPTSVAMVAAYHGAAAPTAEFAEVIHDPHFEIYGNWNRAVQGAYSRGVPGRLERVSSWDAVRRLLEESGPIIASIKSGEGELRGAPYDSTNGHLLVVTGLGVGEAVHVNDPAAKKVASVNRVYRRDDMEKVWFANGGVTYALEAPPVDEQDPAQSK